MNTIKKHFIAIIVVLFLVYIFFVFILPDLSQSGVGQIRRQSPGWGMMTGSSNSLGRLQGRYILQGSTCAGFEFGKDPSTVIWRNEIECAADDTSPDNYSVLALYWLDSNTFVTKDIALEGEVPDHPPRVDIYTIVGNQGGKLLLKQLWTGWGNYSLQTLTFDKQ